jgi:hypothetical protein
LKDLDAQKKFPACSKTFGQFLNFKAAQEDYKG